MNQRVAEDFDTTRSKNDAIGGDRMKKSANVKSRMKKCWRLIRTRRRNLALTAATLGSYHSTDRYQMSVYLG